MVSSKQQEQNDSKRMFMLFGSLLVICGVIVSLFVWSPWSKKDNSDSGPYTEKYDVTVSDQKTINDEAQQFIASAGNFGVHDSGLNINNMHTISFLISRQTTNWKDYVTTREDKFNQLKSQIYESSNLNYDTSVVADWGYGQELSNLMTFKSSDITTNPQKTGKIFKDDDKKVTTASVDATFTSTITKRVVTAEDSSWDGSYRILIQTLENVPVTITFAKDGNKWKVYSIDSPKPSLLATWDPDYNDDGYNKILFEGYTDQQILTPDKKPTPSHG